MCSRRPPGKTFGREFESLQAFSLEEIIKPAARKIGEFGARVADGDVQHRPPFVKKYAGIPVRDNLQRQAWSKMLLELV